MAEGGKGGDGLWLFLFAFGAIFVAGWLVWTAFKPQIIQSNLAIRTAQMDIASLWFNDDEVVAVPMPRSTDDEGPLKAKLGDNERVEMLDTKFGIWRIFANRADSSSVEFDHLRVLSYVALYPWRWICAFLLALMFIWVVFRGPTSLFHRVLNLETLILDQAKTFKVIRPFIKFNPNKLGFRAPGTPVPSKLEKFSEALSPEEWIAFHEIPMPDGHLDRIVTMKKFAVQLGPRWRGAKALPPELKILLACFCMKAARDRDNSDDMLGRLMACWDYEKGLNLSRDRKLFSEAKKILNNKKVSEKVLADCNRHAYVTTALIRALNTARSEGGVLAPAQFLWLREHNRTLWYPLNNLGRQAFHMEALGAMSHYRSEKQVNRPIPKPRMADAVEGLIEHLKDPILARPIPSVDYGDSKPKNKNAGILKPKAA